MSTAKGKAKTPKLAITESEMLAFVEKSSDFSFEMKTLDILRRAGFTCQHSGTYEDPATSKTRQFDIRARRALDSPSQPLVVLAVECKNISCPLLVSATPRTHEESYVDLIKWNSAQMWPIEKARPSFYLSREPVGRAFEQVERRDGDLAAGDESKTFDKMGQAINGCDGLVLDYLVNAGRRESKLILPVIVLPDGLLWQVDYSDDGTVAAAPRQVESTTLILSTTVRVKLPGSSEARYRISHLEIATLSGLLTVIRRLSWDADF